MARRSRRSRNIKNNKKKWEYVIHTSSIDYLEDIKKDNKFKGSMHTKFFESNITHEYFGKDLKNNKLKEGLISHVIKKFKHKNINNKDIWGKYDIFQDEMVEKILEENNKKREKNFIYPRRTPVFYTQFIFNDIKKINPFSKGNTDKVIFIFNKKVLKDLPFLICPLMGGGRCIYGFILKGFYGEGNLTRQPSLKKFKDYLNIKNTEVDYFPDAEILFDEIPLEYVEFILTRKKNVKKVEDIFPDIPVIPIRSNENIKKVLNEIN